MSGIKIQNNRRSTNDEQECKETSIPVHLFMNCTELSAQPYCSSCFFLRSRIVQESNYCCDKDFFVSFIETWPQRFPLFYNGCGGMWQCITHCSYVCLCICTFRLAHFDGCSHDSTVKQNKLPGLTLYNKASLSSFPLWVRRLHNPLNVTCWQGSFMSSPWSNHKISRTNYSSNPPLSLTNVSYWPHASDWQNGVLKAEGWDNDWGNQSSSRDSWFKPSC